MMAFDAPSPGLVSGFPENRDIIKIGIPARRFVFEIEKYLFQTHDRGCFREAALAKAAAEQCLSERALGRSHFSEGQAFARLRNKVPIESLLVLPFVNGLGLLLRCERSQKIGGRLRHFVRR